MRAWKHYIAILVVAAVGCTPDNSVKDRDDRNEASDPIRPSGDATQPEFEVGPGKELYGDVAVLPVASAAELTEIKRRTWLQYLGQDDKHYYLFGHKAVTNRRTHISVYRVAKATVTQGELLKGLRRPAPADVQPPALPDLVNWIEKNKIDVQPLADRKRGDH